MLVLQDECVLQIVQSFGDACNNRLSRVTKSTEQMGPVKSQKR